MPAESRALNFDTLRAWDGSQHRAFEELSYQLLRADVPPGTEAIRTGNPDGGVEWYATLKDGSEHGWQAKHVRFDSLLGAMTATVKRVVSDRPTLVKLTFVISSNLSTGTGGGKFHSQRQKYEDKVAAWKREIVGAAKIEFALIQKSTLLDKLSESKHRGRAWFWWGAPVFDDSWLKDRLTEQSVAAGERYRPDLQVDLPIEDDLKALGFGESPVQEFERLRKRVVSHGREVRLTPAGPRELIKLHKAIMTSAKVVVDRCASLTLSASSAASNLGPLEKSLGKFLDNVREAELVERRLESVWRDLPADDPDRDKKKPSAEAHGYAVRQLRNSVGELASWLDSTEGRALQKRFYFLSGPAGAGKTHLFLDAARRAIDEGRPAVVLFGALFGRGNLWESICDQLGLDPVGADVLLEAMDAAGEAAALTGRRFVILIDALNETVPPDFWASRLPALRAAVARWPHVALAVSCRDTYLDIVDQGTERENYVHRTHPGFAGREVEATHKYFSHYKLEVPRIPLLVPEFTLPLFLRMYCESLLDSDEATASVGHEGRVRTFERYLSAKIKRVARRLRPGAGSAYELNRAQGQARAVVDALLDEFASTGQEATSIARAEELATAAIGGSADDAAIALGALQSEGILTRERLYLGEGATDDGFRIVFQAFADFLLLKRRLAATPEPLQDPDFVRWLSEQASWGIVEAAAVVLPELYEVELPTFLGLTKKSLIEPDRDNDEAWRRHLRARNAYRAFVETLPYREAAAVSEKTIDLLNESMPLLSFNELFRTIFQIAPQPANRLNGNALHRYLLQIRMPRRDATFGFATYHELFDESSPAATLARWAGGGPYPDYDPEVVELACIPLVWLLSSPNRYMRDWVTKSLVQLLRGHLDVMLRLVDRFWTIDDPYVVQRVVVIAYGSLMRSAPAVEADAKKLAERVRSLVFARPVRADELLLDAARGIVEFGVQRRLVPKTALRDIKRPYGIAPPSHPPSEATLDKKYGYKEKQPDDESYSAIHFSLMTMGDFGRYVIEPGMNHFSRYRFEQTFPDKEPVNEPRLIKARWRRFEESLTANQRAALRKLVDGDGEPNELIVLLSDFGSTLSPKQQTLFQNSWQSSRRTMRDDDYPADRAQRWVFRRTLSLGWTPQLFGREDRLLNHGNSRGEHKAERWGKKYQWMAYHELLARVADNYQAARRYDEDEPYEGLHQIIAEREIDPSLPPIPYRELAERKGEGASTWRPAEAGFPHWPPGRIEFGSYGGSIEKFLSDQQSETTLDKAVVTDSKDHSWVILHLYVSQGDPTAEKSWLGLRQDFVLDSWFVPRVQAADFLPKLPMLRKQDHWRLVDVNGHIDCCYFGEIGWTPHRCYHAHRELDEIEYEGERWQLVPTSESYSWEGSLLDCSIGESVSARAPSSFVQSRSNLMHAERGPSWHSSDGAAFANFSPTSDERTAFMVRADWLQTFLEQHDLALLIASWQERRLLDRESSHHHPSEDVYAAARIDAALDLSLSKSLRERR